jgi:hypothetical protein
VKKRRYKKRKTNPSPSPPCSCHSRSSWRYCRHRPRCRWGCCHRSHCRLWSFVAPSQSSSPSVAVCFVVPFSVGGLPSRGSWSPSLSCCGASLAGVVALGVGLCPVGPLGCRLSACSQDVVSLIEIEITNAKKKQRTSGGQK